MASLVLIRRGGRDAPLVISYLVNEPTVSPEILNDKQAESRGLLVFNLR